MASAFNYLGLAIWNMHDSGDTTTMRNPLARLATVLDRLGRYESAATIAGFAAVNPMATTTPTELGALRTHLREILGNQTNACAHHA